MVIVLAEERTDRVEKLEDVERIAGIWRIEHRGEDGGDDESVNAGTWGRA